MHSNERTVDRHPYWCDAYHKSDIRATRVAEHYRCAILFRPSFLPFFTFYFFSSPSSYFVHIFPTVGLNSLTFLLVSFG